MNDLARILERVLAWMLIVLMAASVVNVLWQVFTRFVLQNPSSYTEELARYLLVWIGVLSAAYGVGTRSHLAIDLLPMKLEGRRRQWLEVFIQTCLLVFAIGVMVVGGIRLVGVTLFLEQTSAALSVKLGHVYLVLPISGGIIAFFAAVHLLEATRGLTGPDQTGVEAGEPHMID